MRVLLVATVVLAALPASADDTIPTIKLTEYGPDQSIPVGSSFYLTGTADAGVSDVQVVIVARGTRTLLGTWSGLFTRAPDCSTIAGRWDPPKPLGQIYKIGSAKASDVWKSGDPGMDVYLPPRWHRGVATGSTTYKILVPGARFFTTGGAYCLFVYKATHHVKVDASTVKDALFKAAQGEAGGVDTSQKCTQWFKGQGGLAAKKIVQDLKPQSLTDLCDAADRYWSTIHTLASVPDDIGSILGTWSKTAQPSGARGLTAPLELPGYRDVKTDLLARATLGLLIEHDAAYGYIVWRHRRPSTRFVTRDGSMPIRSLRILDDGKTIQVMAVDPDDARRDPKRRKTLEIQTSALTFGASDVSLRDVLELMRGRIRLNGAYESIPDLQAELQATFAAPLAGKEVSAEQRAQLAAVQKRVKLLAKTIEGMLLASTKKAKSATGTYREILHDLGLWMSKGNLLTRCSSSTAVDWGQYAEQPECLCVARSVAGAWPGYRQGSPQGVCTKKDVEPRPHEKGPQPPYTQNPLEFLDGSLSTYQSALDRLPELTKRLTVTVDTVTTAQAVIPTPTTVTYTEDQWVFSYVTPVTGVAFILRASRPFPLFYLGVELHFVPNPVNEPLYTRRNYGYRMFALELGMATSTKDLGPDGRFAGWNGLPPVFFGLAVHLIPYTSITIGGVVMERRSSTVTQEAPKAWVSWYGGLSVQANIPDLIASLKGRSSSTSSSK